MQNFSNGFFLGIRTWFRAWNFIFSNGLIHYFLYPVILSVILGMGVFVVIHQVADMIVDLVCPYFEYTPLAEGGTWSVIVEFLSNIAAYAVGFILWAIALYIFFRIKKYLVLALMSPMMSMLSERTSEILNGVKYTFDGQQFVRDIFRGIYLSCRNLVVETFIGCVIWMFTLFLTVFTGGMGVLVSPLIALLGFGIGAYFYGFSTIDYSNERSRLNVKQSISMIRNNKGLAVGNGMIFDLLMMLPFLGATIATVTCTVSATLAVHELERKK